MSTCTKHLEYTLWCLIITVFQDWTSYGFLKKGQKRANSITVSLRKLNLFGWDFLGKWFKAASGETKTPKRVNLSRIMWIGDLCCPMRELKKWLERAEWDHFVKKQRLKYLNADNAELQKQFLYLEPTKLRVTPIWSGIANKTHLDPQNLVSKVRNRSKFNVAHQRYYLMQRPCPN